MFHFQDKSDAAAQRAIQNKNRSENSFLCVKQKAHPVCLRGGSKIKLFRCIVECPNKHLVLISLPAALAKFTTRPLVFFTSERNVFVMSIIPHRFTSAVRLNIFSGVHSIGSMWQTPALFTRPHRPAT